jgi:hypothetical protein
MDSYQRYNAKYKILIKFDLCRSTIIIQYQIDWKSAIVLNSVSPFQNLQNHPYYL